MKKLIILLGLVLISFAVSSQSYLKYETLTDTTYTKKKSGKLYEIQEITTKDGRLITVKKEVKDKIKIIAKLDKQLEKLQKDLEMVDEEKLMTDKNLDKQKSKLQRKIKFIQKRKKNIEKRLK